MIRGLTPQIRNELIKQRFVMLHNKVNDLQKVYDEYDVDGGKIEKIHLNNSCYDKQMKDVLTEIHFEIVKGNENTFNALLDGNRNEMQDAFKWQQVFQSLYLQASTLQSICLPLMFSGNDLDKYIVKQTDIAEKDYQV